MGNREEPRGTSHLTLEVRCSHITDFHVLLIIEGRGVITSGTYALVTNFAEGYYRCLSLSIS